MRIRTRNLIGCPPVQNITLQQRLRNVRVIPWYNAPGGGLFSDFRVIELGRNFISFRVPGGPGEGNGPTIERLSFNEPLALFFPISKNKRVRTISKGILNIQAKPQMAISDLDGLEVGIIRVGKDFIEVIPVNPPRKFVPRSRVLIPLNKFTRVTCFDDEDEE